MQKGKEHMHIRWTGGKGVLCVSNAVLIFGLKITKMKPELVTTSAYRGSQYSTTSQHGPYPVSRGPPIALRKGNLGEYGPTTFYKSISHHCNTLE